MKKVETKYYEGDDIIKSLAFKNHLFVGGFYASVNYNFLFGHSYWLEANSPKHLICENIAATSGANAHPKGNTGLVRRNIAHMQHTGYASRTNNHVPGNIGPVDRNIARAWSNVAPAEILILYIQRNILHIKRNIMHIRWNMLFGETVL